MSILKLNSAPKNIHSIGSKVFSAGIGGLVVIIIADLYQAGKSLISEKINEKKKAE